MLAPSEIPAGAAFAEVHPVKSFGGTVRLPGSKSLTNRALLIAALARGKSRLRNLLDCDDSRYLLEALSLLGVTVRVPSGTAADGDAAAQKDGWVIEVDGAGGELPGKRGSFFLGNAGTATRFLTAALTTAGGQYTVDGDERMRQRPIAPLVKALNALGASVRAPSGCPPVEIGPQRLVGGDVSISGETSSQYVSAILMAGPMARRNVSVRIEGSLVSSPYVELTLGMMREFGAKSFLDDRRPDGQPVYGAVAGRLYKGRDYFVEGDASAASYFCAAAAVTGDTVRVEGVGKESEQGDLRCVDVLAAMGCRVNKEADAVTVTGAGSLLRGADCDCSDMPDVVPTLAVAGAFARGRTRLRGASHLRFKESDRIRSVATEIAKLGVRVRELDDGLEIEGSRGIEALSGATIDAWGDHRVAMAFSIAGLVLPGVIIRDPCVVRKSFPGFFGALRALGAHVTFRDASGRVLEGPELAGSAP
jgi:3-phosphoshikimate 1-carboxyvinyltransferase